MPMQSDMPPSDIDWARRVNRSWIVRGQLADHAEAWMNYLEQAQDGRLLVSTAAARTMCGWRKREDDPKPWFYSGLFHLADADEARQFLGMHRVTRAVVPSMREDEDVRLWMDRVGPETVEMIQRLRKAVDGIGQPGKPPPPT